MRKLKIAEYILMSKEDDQYLGSLALITAINGEETSVLIKKIKAGDRAALGRLIEGYTPHILQVAKRYINLELSLEELVNAGKEWLAIHCKTFDTDKFLRFSEWCIRQEMLKKLAEVE